MQWFRTHHAKENNCCTFALNQELMPEISRFYGIIIYMFYSEHNPPHFHVKYQEYEATIDIIDGVVRGVLPRRALSLIFEWLDIHKDDLLENWKLMAERKPLNKIEPLK